MDNQDIVYCDECGNEVNGTVCNNCGAQKKPRKNDEHVPLKGSGWQPNISGYLSSNDFNVWYKGIRISILILGIINLIFAPYFGIIYLFLGLLIYLFKSVNLIILFTTIWLITAFSQLFVGFSNLTVSYLLIAMINVIFSSYILFKVNVLREFHINQINSKQKELDIDEDKHIDSLWLLVTIMIPGLGILGGLYYVWKGRKGSWTVVGLGAIIWGLIALILYAYTI